MAYATFLWTSRASLARTGPRTGAGRELDPRRIPLHVDDASIHHSVAGPCDTTAVLAGPARAPARPGQAAPEDRPGTALGVGRIRVRWRQRPPRRGRRSRGRPGP